MRTLTPVPLLLLITGLAGCGSSTTTTTMASPVLAMFTDSSSGVRTSDVRDVQDQIVEFDINNHSLIWKADGRTFPGFTVNGNSINANLQVRFGTKDGERRAYLTDTVNGTLSDVEVVNGQVVISATNVAVPDTRKAPVIAQFTEAGSTVMTSDVRDADRQIVRFDIANNELIWTADGRTFSGYSVNGNFINVSFQVRFGTEDGERRAYFTETARPYLCNIEIVNDQVVITATDVPVPGGG